MADIPECRIGPGLPTAHGVGVMGARGHLCAGGAVTGDAGMRESVTLRHFVLWQPPGVPYKGSRQGRAPTGEVLK